MIYKDGDKIDKEATCKICLKELVFHGEQPKMADRICQKCKGDK